MESSTVTVVVKCPECHRRVIDKLSPAEGTIRIKCPHCRQEVSINLALRLNSKPATLKYRLA
jgi:predicted metal-dependent hydrolase